MSTNARSTHGRGAHGRPPVRRALGCAAAIALLLGAAGCLDYTIETTIRPDGSGVRATRMEANRNTDFDLSGEELRALTSAGRDDRWKTSTRVEEGGDTTWVLERRTEVDELGEWAELAQSPLIRGTLPDRADRRLGYVRLGDVVFRSTIQVGVSRRSDGTSTVSYREAFVWDEAADALTEFLLRDLDERLAEGYPRLDAPERAGIIGYARARIAEAGEDGLWYGEDEDELAERAVEQIVGHALKVIRVRHPGVAPDALRRTLREMLLLEDADDEELERDMLEMLPGLNLGVNTSVVFRLTLPGTVTTTNGERRDDGTVEWTFGPLDALARPVEVFAEATVGG